METLRRIKEMRGHDESEAADMLMLYIKEAFVEVV